MDKFLLYHTSLRDIVQDLKLQAPHEAGLIKEPSSYVRSSPKKGLYWDLLPKLKLKKSALSRRDRIGAEKRRAAITLNIKDTKKEPRIEEELAVEDGALHDSDFQPFIDLTKGREQKEGKKLNSDLIKASPIKKKKPQKNPTEKDNQNEVLETNFVPPYEKPKSQRKLLFSIQEKGNILQGKMLTDESINLAQKLLAKQFPGISGLMDTCLGKRHLCTGYAYQIWKQINVIMVLIMFMTVYVNQT